MTTLETIENEEIVSDIKQQPTLLITYLGEPVEICDRSSCMYHEYLSFRNTIVRKIYDEMVVKFDTIFKIDMKKSKLKVDITWQSNKFNDDLFEYDFDAINCSIKEALFVSGVLNRKDKYFKNGNSEKEMSGFITIKKMPGNVDSRKDLFVIGIYFEVESNKK